mmetsp:Transcript_16601/g.56093  ORF Transcript_16601/g.56093 Transcript_16601/m.56093 type:complete len:227 (+) Transcript_16601:148-828(+)
MPSPLNIMRASACDEFEKACHSSACKRGPHVRYAWRAYVAALRAEENPARVARQGRCFASLGAETSKTMTCGGVDASPLDESEPTGKRTPSESAEAALIAHSASCARPAQCLSASANDAVRCTVETPPRDPKMAATQGLDAAATHFLATSGLDVFGDKASAFGWAPQAPFGGAAARAGRSEAARSTFDVDLFFVGGGTACGGPEVYVLCNSTSHPAPDLFRVPRRT